MNRVLIAFLIFCIVSLACGAPTLMTPGDYVDRFGGDITIYTRILSMTDCTELQREFEKADEDAKLHEPGTEEYQSSVGYRTAADNRMKELECNGNL